MDEDRYCTNCRAQLPERESVCPACGVFAGDVFDGRMPKAKRSRGGWLGAIAVVALAAAAFWYVSTPAPTPPSKPKPFVAKPAKNEREAIDAVRRYLVAKGTRNECLALIGKGARDRSYAVNAVDHCAHKTIGQFVVATGGQVTKR